MKTLDDEVKATMIRLKEEVKREINGYKIKPIDGIARLIYAMSTYQKYLFDITYYNKPIDIRLQIDAIAKILKGTEYAFNCLMMPSYIEQIGLGADGDSRTMNVMAWLSYCIKDMTLYRNAYYNRSISYNPDMLASNLTYMRDTMIHNFIETIRGGLEGLLEYMNATMEILISDNGYYTDARAYVNAPQTPFIEGGM